MIIERLAWPFPVYDVISSQDSVDVLPRYWVPGDFNSCFIGRQRLYFRCSGWHCKEEWSHDGWREEWVRKRVNERVNKWIFYSLLFSFVTQWSRETKKLFFEAVCQLTGKSWWSWPLMRRLSFFYMKLSWVYSLTRTLKEKLEHDFEWAALIEPTWSQPGYTAKWGPLLTSGSAWRSHMKAAINK